MGTGPGGRGLASVRLPQSDCPARARPPRGQVRNAGLHERLVQAEMRASDQEERPRLQKG